MCQCYTEHEYNSICVNNFLIKKQLQLICHSDCLFYIFPHFILLFIDGSGNRIEHQ